MESTIGRFASSQVKGVRCLEFIASVVVSCYVCNGSGGRDRV